LASGFYLLNHHLLKKCSSSVPSLINYRDNTTNKASMNTPSLTSAQSRAGFFRRLGALIYDAFMALSLGMVVVMISLAAIVICDHADLIKITGSHADYLTQQLWFKGVFWLSILLFYMGFWCKAGQTIGMRAWRIQLQNRKGGTISPAQAILRIATALLGLGNLLVLLDRRHKWALQDWATKTDVVFLGKVKDLPKTTSAAPVNQKASKG
jgi:uncharacterized RDD family membrane protein YckC